MLEHFHKMYATQRSMSSRRLSSRSLRSYAASTASVIWTWEGEAEAAAAVAVRLDARLRKDAGD